MILYKPAVEIVVFMEGVEVLNSIYLLLDVTWSVAEIAVVEMLIAGVVVISSVPIYVVDIPAKFHWDGNFLA